MPWQSFPNSGHFVHASAWPENDARRAACSLVLQAGLQFSSMCFVAHSPVGAALAAEERVAAKAALADFRLAGLSGTEVCDPG